MLYNFIKFLGIEHTYFLKYITFRGGMAILTALIISIAIGGKAIKLLKKIQSKGQPIRKDGPKSHLQTKKGTPTMGGVIILFSLLISSLLWCDWTNPYIWVMSFVTFGYAAIGFADDYLKLRYNNSDGIPARYKLLLQILIGGGAAYWVNYLSIDKYSTVLAFPFFKNFFLDLGFFYMVFGCIVVAGASNAVNLTDGLDGLAMGPIIIASSCFALISYLVGNSVFAQYLNVPYVAKSGEIAVFLAAIIGGGLGFLWYNAPPARVFMGDVGSLSLGAAIGVASMITKHELVLVIIGGLFVIEALSVIIQVVSYKLRKKRVFKMAPIHHHFEYKGWSEPTIVIRFWIIAIIFALIGLATLKLR